MITRKSFAKINLYLEMVGIATNRHNNKDYHLIDSLKVMIDIFDQISIEKNDHFELKIIGNSAQIIQENQENNIIAKAVNLMAKTYDFEPNVKITLEKNIPIGAGLGGGSSNAAIVMLEMNQLFNLDLPNQELLDLGLKIGADVPFFLNGKTSFASGFGENLTPANFDCEDLHLLIVNPKIHLSTPEVFRKFSNNPSKKFGKSHNRKNNFIDLLEIKNRHNDLTESATKIVAQISDILNEIEEQKNCLTSRMSGSGASCFGIFDNEKDLELAYEKLRKSFPNFYLQKTKFIKEY
ncbi:MAG: 4-diphosphocytidyl-2-C-methyl-D-erythritol kinase [Rickettsiales bacterium]|jgi:4-diphosphocytidyl-2-C-methyl-D-erythritol kinase